MTTSVQVQYRRGTASQVASFTGAPGEIVIDTTNNRVVVQDGATPGGFPAAKLAEAVTAIQSSGGSTISASGSVVTIGEAGGGLNGFYNAALDVWQRGASGTATTVAGPSTQIGPDGFYIVPTGASVAWAQAGGRLITKNALQVTGAASVTDLIIKQRIESLIAARFCSQTVTVQAQVYNGAGGPITPLLTVKHASAVDNWSSSAADVAAVGLQSCPANGWTRVAYTFTGNASSYNGLEVSFDFGNNFGANTKTLQVCEFDIRVTPAVPTGVNSDPPPPELRPIAAELALCQRYYELLTHNATGDLLLSGGSIVAGVYSFVWSYKVTKRAAPAFTLLSGSWTGATPTIDASIDGALFLSSAGSFYVSGGTSGSPAAALSAEL